MLHVWLHEGGKPLSEVRWAGCFRAECGPLCPGGRSLRPMHRCRTAKERGSRATRQAKTADFGASHRKRGERCASGKLRQSGER